MLKHNDAIVDLYVHEIALHNAHNIDDFRPPYGVEDDAEDQADYITPAHVDSLTVCLESIHKTFDAFINMPLSTIRALPTFFFVRNSYAAVALIKLFNLVMRKGSRLGSVFKPDDLKVDYYLDALLETSKRAGENGMSRVAVKFIFVFGMLREWKAKRAGGSMTQKDKGMLSASNFVLNWEKKLPSDGVNAQDPKSSSWTVANKSSGLQMLSEVAMGEETQQPGSRIESLGQVTASTDPAPMSGTQRLGNNSDQAAAMQPRQPSDIPHFAATGRNGFGGHSGNMASSSSSTTALAPYAPSQPMLPFSGEQQHHYPHSNFCEGHSGQQNLVSGSNDTAATAAATQHQRQQQIQPFSSSILTPHPSLLTPYPTTADATAAAAAAAAAAATLSPQNSMAASSSMAEPGLAATGLTEADPFLTFDFASLSSMMDAPGWLDFDLGL